MQITVDKVEAVLADQAVKIIKQAKHEITGDEARAVVQAIDWLTDLSKRVKGAALAEAAATLELAKQAPAPQPEPPVAKGRAKK